MSTLFYVRKSTVVLTPALALLLAVGCGGGDTASGSGNSASGSTTADMTETESDTDSEGTTTDTDTTATATDTTPTTTTPTTAGPTTSDSETTSETSSDELLFDCGMIPKAAVDAEFEHTVEVSGGVPSYTITADGLPEGLELVPVTGFIYGAPTTAGSYDVTITVDDSGGNQEVNVCTINVNEKAHVDLTGLDTPCLLPGMSLLDYVVGGNGEDIVCSTPGGYGNGKIPEGVQVNADTCLTEGFVAETTYGTWAWIVAAEQSGATFYAPYCASQTNQAPGAYEITGTHQGGDHLVPATGTFKLDTPIKFDGEAEPSFLVENNCGNPCTYKSIAEFTGSPFGGGACADDADGCIGLCPLEPDQNEPDGDKQQECPSLQNFTGFRHELWAKGAPVPEDFTARPWIVSFLIHHCMSNNPADCEGNDNIIQNGKTNLEFSIIMNPE